MSDDDDQPKQRGRRGRKFEIPEELDRYSANDESAASIFDDGLIEWPEDIDEPTCPEGVEPRVWASERLPSRLTYMRGLLSRGMYDYGRHPQIIADKWGISSARVKQICSEAERQLSLLQGKANEASSEFFVERLLKVAAKAEASQSFMAAISGVKAAAELVVARPTQRVDVTHQYVSMTQSELAAEYRKELMAANKLGLLKPGEIVQDAVFEENSDGDRVTPVAPEGSGDE